jgi:gas vesicle protein
MSQSDNFFGGFLLGTLVGGIVGGVVGVVVASKLNSGDDDSERFSKLGKGKDARQKIKPSTEQSIELARQGLETKIAQLNDAIDDVRQQLNTVNGAPSAGIDEESLTSE